MWAGCGTMISQKSFVYKVCRDVHLSTALIIVISIYITILLITYYMRAECLKEKLVSSLAKAERVTSKNPSLAILESVLLGASDNQLVIKSTNLEVGVELTVPSKVVEEGVVAVNAGPLLSFLNTLPEEKNVLLDATSKGALVVNCGKHTASFKTVPYEDFPHIPSPSGSNYQVDCESLLQGLRDVWYSASVSGIKPELSSVYLYNEGDSLVFTATDSFRLAEKKIKSKNPPHDLSILIPQKNIPDIIKVLEGVRGEASVSIENGQVSVSVPHIYITSRLVIGNFFEYRKIFPKEFSTEVVLLRDDIVQALRMMKIFSDKFNQVSLSIVGSKETCEIKSKNSDVGEATYVFKAKVKGESVTLNFNHKYLFDCLQSIKSDSVVFKFNGAGKALLVEGYNDNSFIYLVMPNR